MADDIDELESAYQSSKVLQSGSSAHATIVDAGYRITEPPEEIAHLMIGDSGCLIYFTLDVAGVGEYHIAIPKSYDHAERDGFVNLCVGYGEPVEDLEMLCGETVDVTLDRRHESTDVIISLGFAEARGYEIEDENLISQLPTQLPDEYVDKLRIVYQYALTPDDTVELKVSDLTHEDDTLTVHLQGGGKLAFDTRKLDESPYHRLVENVGQGSVRQIRGSSLHITHFDECHVPDQGAVDVVDDELLEHRMRNMSMAELAETYPWVTSESEILEGWYDGFIRFDRNQFGKWVISSEPMEIEIHPEVVLFVAIALLLGIYGFLIANATVLLVAVVALSIVGGLQLLLPES